MSLHGDSPRLHSYVNAQGGHCGTALQAASARGHEAVVRMLLEKDANVNAQGGEYGNVLYVASAGCHEAVVRLLLEKDANLHAQGGLYGSALQAASAGGHEAVAQPQTAITRRQRTVGRDACGRGRTRCGR